VALLGIPDRAGPVNWNLIIFNGLTLKGVYGREMCETWYKMTVMIQGGLDITPVITHRFPVERFAEAFAAAASGEGGKVVLSWKEE
jgi:threonine 3-dehydrogenase